MSDIAFQMPIDPFGFRVEISDCQFNYEMKFVRVAKLIDRETGSYDELTQFCSEDQVDWFVRTAKSEITNRRLARKAAEYTGNSYRSFWE